MKLIVPFLFVLPVVYSLPEKAVPTPPVTYNNAPNVVYEAYSERPLLDGRPCRGRKLGVIAQNGFGLTDCQTWNEGHERSAARCWQLSDGTGEVRSCVVFLYRSTHEADGTVDECGHFTGQSRMTRVGWGEYDDDIEFTAWEVQCVGDTPTNIPPDAATTLGSRPSGAIIDMTVP